MTLEIALELNAETGWPVFPCKADKAPACPRGFHAAAADPAGIRGLWQRFPGPLSGVPTGPASGISVLDLDTTKHPEAVAWLDQHRTRLGNTLVIQTRSGGQHWVYHDRPDLRCSVAKLAP
ncbi:MAG: bifunctional DNA primase/polymerase, partial [Acidiphilium sp.]|nr:bifunctional DNA primase/polymerase [Acidiphilium sp.]